MLINNFMLLISVILCSCTPLDIANSLVTLGLPNENEINIEELYWDPKEIYDTGCKDVSGRYLVPSSVTSIGGIPAVVSNIKKNHKKNLLGRVIGLMSY